MSADNGSSASNDQQVSDDVDSTGNETRQIKPEDHLRAIEDLKKFKARSRELESQVAKMQADLEEVQNKKLTDSNDFKALYEQATQKNKDWEAKYSKLRENTVYNEKYRAAQQALIQAGIRKEALKLLDKEPLEEIVVEYTSEGRVLTSGIEEYVDNFKKNFGSFAFEDKRPTKVNGGGGAGGSMNDSSVTANDVYMIEKKHGIGSQEYRDALASYKKQKNR